MLPPPYPNNNPRHHHHYHCSSRQESPSPSPTAGFMPPATPFFDDYGRFFPGDMYNQETLEAVLRQTVTAPVPAEAEAEVELEKELAGNGSPAAADGGRAGVAARKRPFRTDRHSKIRTAHGVRDRRMRLSVGVARDFFALQDKLGFDKASKTVDWLLTQSRPAIERLAAPPAPAAASVPATGFGGAGPRVLKKGVTGSSSNAGGFSDAREAARSWAWERTGSRGCDGSPAALMEERACGGGELDRFLSQSSTAAAMTAEQTIDGWETYYYQYCQLEEMMRAATTQEYELR